MNRIKMLIRILKRMLLSPTAYARAIGVTIGEGCILYNVEWSSEPYLITVGNNCQITKGVKFFTHGGAFVLRNEIPDFDCFGKIEIKNGVYIGNNSLILPGVTIGNNVLVAAGSVVSRSVPDNVCIGGNPARIICTLEEYKQKNIAYNVHSKALNGRQKKELLLALNDERFIQKAVLSH
ncbi:acyltransferase [Niabella sp.]|uniref:acyltransferase n=1 Tax=Niabella sp. TaxID=1962976 RepID=UPI002620D95F|nr:acyltransferase [Niabella sp.]